MAVVARDANSRAGYGKELGVTSIVLICSVLASLAVGVLVAYAVCLSLFGLFRVHARQVSEQRHAVQQSMRPAA